MGAEWWRAWGFTHAPTEADLLPAWQVCLTRKIQGAAYCKQCKRSCDIPPRVRLWGEVETHLFKGQLDLDRYDPRQRRLE